MKLFILFALSALLNTAFAGETSTDCPMMRQGRGNPKANMTSQSKKPVSRPSESTKAQSI